MLKLKNSLLWLAIVVLIVACSDDDENDSPSQVLTARIGTKDFSANEIEGYRFESNPNNIVVQGFNEDEGFIIAFQLDEVEVGSYDLVTEEVTLNYFLPPAQPGFPDTYVPISGTIDVTVVTDSRFEATFNAVVESIDGTQFTITNGLVKSNVVIED
jgi:hypothetical protein